MEGVFEFTICKGDWKYLEATKNLLIEPVEIKRQDILNQHKQK